MIYMSMPCSYNTILTSVSTNMMLQKTTVTSNKLMAMIINTYEQLVAQGTIKSKVEKNDTAFKQM